MTQTPGASPGTSAEDYELTYYSSHLGGEDYGWETESWREFFRRVAARLHGIASPATVLDVGCARGLLVQALREQGVDARGFDVSRHAVESAHADVREHLWVQSATSAIEGRYDLLTCIEVLEHMSPAEADVALDRMCAASDVILFSSSPGDFAEPTHVNVRPTFEWVTAFAERGFYRRTDVSLDFLTGWAALLVKETVTVRDVVARYESQYAALHDEVLGKRAGLLEAHREIGRLHALVNDPDAAVRVERERAEHERQSVEVRGLLKHTEQQLVLAHQRAEALERLVNALESRVRQLQKQATKQRRTSRDARKKLRVTRRRLERTQGQLRRQRTRARKAEQQLEQLVSSRAYRTVRALGRPGRAWRRTGDARRRSRRTSPPAPPSNP